MKRLAINVLSILLTLGIGLGVHALRSRDVRGQLPDRETEEYSVYSDPIKSLYSNDANLLLIANETIPTYQHRDETTEKEFIKSHMPAATTKETFEDYKLVASQTRSLANRFAVNRKYLLISNEEAKSYFEVSRPRIALREKYPNSTGRITMFSRVAFNRSMNEALVYAWAYCGGECGGGGYYLLRKENGVWTVKDKKLWVS